VVDCQRNEGGIEQFQVPAAANLLQARRRLTTGRSVCGTTALARADW
jgi:hypothetical protein